MGYYRYQYFLDVESKYIFNRAGYKKWLRPGVIHLGEWYAHENTPYIKGNSVVRDYYGEQQILIPDIQGLEGNPHLRAQGMEGLK